MIVADGLLRSPGFDDPREPEVAQFPPALRWFTSLSARSTARSRKGTTVLHYRFQENRCGPQLILGFTVVAGTGFEPV